MAWPAAAAWPSHRGLSGPAGTAEIKADPETLRALAEARQAVQEGNIVCGTDAVRDLLNRHKVS